MSSAATALRHFRDHLSHWFLTELQLQPAPSCRSTPATATCRFCRWRRRRRGWGRWWHWPAAFRRPAAEARDRLWHRWFWRGLSHRLTQTLQGAGFLHMLRHRLRPMLHDRFRHWLQHRLRNMRYHRLWHRLQRGLGHVTQYRLWHVSHSVILHCLHHMLWRHCLQDGL